MMSVVESIRKIVESEIRKLHLTELGQITDVFPHKTDSDKENYECNVTLKDKGVELRKVPVATSHIGLAHIPHVGDLVLLSFINGDINSPIITGRLYNDEDRPPTTKMEEIVYQPPYKTDTKLRRTHISLPGGTVTISAYDDRLSAIAGKSSFSENSAGEIALHSTKDSNSQTGSFLDIDNGKIICSSKGGGTCKINLSESGDITIETSKDINITCKNNMTIKCTKDFTVTCGGKFSLESKGVSVISKEPANTLSLDSEGALKLDGLSLAAKGKTETKLESDAVLSVNSKAPMAIKSDALASIESVGPMLIKGLMVNINP